MNHGIATYFLFKSDILWTLCEKTDEGKTESIILIHVSSFLSLNQIFPENLS